MADNWVQIDLYSKLFIVIGFKLFKAASNIKSNAAIKMQHSLFIFNGTVFDAFGKKIHCRLVQCLKLCLAQLLDCITLWLPITCLGNLTPVQHSKLQDSTVMLMSPIPLPLPHNHHITLPAFIAESELCKYSLRISVSKPNWKKGVVI